MSRISAKRIGLAIIGASVAMWLVLTAVARADAAGLAAAYPLGAFGWMVPVAAGAAVGLVAWVALGTGTASDPDSIIRDEHPCAACGRMILDDWRLCPYCGTLVDDGSGEPAV